MQNRQIQVQKADWWLSEAGGGDGDCANGDGVSFWGDGNVLELDVVVV